MSQGQKLSPLSFPRSLDDDVAQIERLSRLHRYRSWEGSFGNLVPAKANRLGMLGRQPFDPDRPSLPVQSASSNVRQERTAQGEPRMTPMTRIGQEGRRCRTRPARVPPAPLLFPIR